ncbi:MAG: hypothetical protein WCF17_11665 [Terracidiphilus sp.]
MPTLEGTDYDRFSIEDMGQQPLTLEEAVRKAKELRQGDPTNFYRVEIADEANMTFKVKKVDASSVYAEFMGRVTNLMGRYVLRSRRK